MRTARRSKLVASLMAIVILTSSCLWPTGLRTQVTWGGGNFLDAPDPAFAPLYFALVQAFTTNATLLGERAHVPSFTLSVLDGDATGWHDALPTLPNWSRKDEDGSQTWAPSVRKVGSRYILLFSSMRANSTQMCLGMATSTSLTGTFTPDHAFELCGHPGGGGQQKHNWIDPQMFIDPTTSKVWLLYADMWPGGGNANIMVQQMTSSGRRTVGGPKTLLTYTQAVEAAGLGPAAVGTNSKVENPAMVKDPHNFYDLIVSVGTWNQSSKYHTVQVPCVFADGACIPSRGGRLPLTGASQGGASLLIDSTPENNWIAWHTGHQGGSRPMYISKTTAVNLN